MGVLIEEDTMDWKPKHLPTLMLPSRLWIIRDKKVEHAREMLTRELGRCWTRDAEQPWSTTAPFHGEHMTPTKNVVNLDIREQQESHRMQLQRKGLQAIETRSQDVE
jgi:hypothetical protein